MINVDDEIADLQVAKIGEKGPREVSTLLRGTTLFLEDIGLGIHLETGLSSEKPFERLPRVTRTAAACASSDRSIGIAMMS